MATSQKLVLCWKRLPKQIWWGNVFWNSFCSTQQQCQSFWLRLAGAGHRFRVFGTTSVSGSELLMLALASRTSHSGLSLLQSQVWAEPLSLGCCSVAAHLRARPTTPFWGKASALALLLLCGFSCTIEPVCKGLGCVRPDFTSTIPVTAPEACLGTNSSAV